MKDDARMAMWAGVFVLIGCLALAAIAIMLGRRSQIFESTYTLRTAFDDVQGLSPGAAVRVAGVSVGTVSAVELPENLETGNVVVILSVNSKYMDRVRTNSVASIRTLGLLGDKYVEISMGSRAAAQLHDGGFVKGSNPIDYYQVAHRAESAFAQVLATIDSLNRVLAQFEKGGTLDNLARMTGAGAKIVERVETGPGFVHTIVYDQKFAKTADDIEYITCTLHDATLAGAEGKGSLGSILLGPEMKDAMVALRKSSESLSHILTEVQSGKGLLNALIYSPEERRTLSDIRTAAAELSNVLKRIENSDGSLGLLINDPSVWENLKRLLGGVERSTVMRYLISQSIAEDKPAQAPPKPAPEPAPAPAAP